MSKSHPYRIQLHCNKQMHNEINNFAQERGLSQSATARVLIDRALSSENDAISAQLNELSRLVKAVLHASSASRVLASEAVKQIGSDLTGEELIERVTRLLERYKKYEG
jgi:uncharacterized NAD(P)/FAD-binding protein YdhS